MRCAAVLLLWAAAAAAARYSVPASAGPSRAVSWWYSADNKTEVPIALATIKAHAAVFTSVMLYCGYSVASNGSLSYDAGGSACEGASGMVAGLRALGVKYELVVNTPAGDPVAPFRAAFADPSALSSGMVAETRRWGDVHGWNMDLEPATSAASDATGYASLLTALRAALPATVRLTADVADWSPMLNNYAVLAASGVDRLMDMETYNGDSLAQWLSWYRHFVTPSMPRHKASVGLGCWLNAATAGTWAVTNASATQRMQQVIADNVTEVSMFRLLPAQQWPEPFWWQHLHAYVDG